MVKVDRTPITTEPVASKRGLAQLALRGTVWSILGNYGEQLIGFVSTLIFTNVLDIEVFGLLAIALPWIGYLNIRSKLGLNYAVTAQSETTPELLGTYFVLDVGAGLLSLFLTGGVALILQSTGFFNPIVTQIMIALTLAEAIATLASPYAIALEREMQLSRVSLNKLLVALVAYGIGLALALAGFGIVSQIALNVVAYLLAAVGVVILCRWRLPAIFAMRWRFDRALAKTLLRTGVVSGLALAVTHFVSTFDYVLIGAFVSTEAAAFYERAFRIASWPQVLVTLVVARAGYLTFVRVKDDPPRLAHAVRLCLWALLTFGTPMMLMLVFGAPNIVRGFYGERYFESVRYVRFLGVVTFCWSFINVGLWLAVALGSPHRSLTVGLVQAGILLVTGLVLTSQFGVMGTLAAVALAMLAGCALSLLYAHRITQLRWSETYLRPIVATVLCAAALWALIQLPLYASNEMAAVPAGIPPRVYWLGRAAIVGVSAYVVYLGLVVAMQPIEMRERIGYLRSVWRNAA